MVNGELSNIPRVRLLPRQERSFLMNRKSVGLLLEYVGYLVLVIVLYQWSVLAGEIAVGVLVAYSGIRLRVGKSGKAP